MFQMSFSAFWCKKSQENANKIRKKYKGRNLSFSIMSSNHHKVHLKLGERMLEESLNHDGFSNTICIDQAMVQFLKKTTLCWTQQSNALENTATWLTLGRVPLTGPWWMNLKTKSLPEKCRYRTTEPRTTEPQLSRSRDLFLWCPSPLCILTFLKF